VFAAVGIGEGVVAGVAVLSVTTPALFEFCPGPQPNPIAISVKTADSVIKVFIALFFGLLFRRPSPRGLCRTFLDQVGRFFCIEPLDHFELLSFGFIIGNVKMF